MINKTIKWFCTRMKLRHKQLSVRHDFITHNWRAYVPVYLLKMILLAISDLVEILLDKRITSAEKIDKLAEISLCCMMLADKLRNKKE